MISKSFVDLRNFDVYEEIGRGTFGIVHRAVRKATSKHPEKACAVKFLTKIINMGKFITEVQCQANLRHEAVLQLIGFSLPFQGAGEFAVITDLMPNKSLQKLIKDVSLGTAPKEWETIRAINIFGIAAGMAYVHQKKIIHRDLKSENIMLDNDYHPKIADFGFSKIFEEGTQNQINQTLGIGSPAYMAPEFFDNEHYSNKIDVFSYAIILYEILTLNKPWDKHKNVTIFTLPALIKEGKRPIINENEVSDDYKELIHRCWDQEPDNRPKFIRIVKGFMDYKEKYFDPDLVDYEALEDYIDLAIKGLDFSVLDE